MKTKLLLVLRILLWLLPVSILGSAILAEGYFRQKEELAIARSSLLEGDLERAAGIYSRLIGSFWVGDEALAGEAIVQCLQDEPVSQAAPLVGEALRSFPGNLLLIQSYQNREFSACLRLAELLTASEPEGLAELFKASALIELNRFDEATEAWTAVSTSRRESWFGERLRSVRLRLGDSTRTFVYDRRGTPLGIVNSEGSFEPDAAIELSLLQSKPVERALKAEAGDGIRLSLDLDLTRAAQDALSGYRGTIVMLEPETGEVLAAVSDTRSLQREPFPAFEQLREPASISKLITTTASLRAGLDADAEIARMSCSGAERYHGGVLYCAYRAGPLGGLDRAMAVSCNIAFANLGVRIGRSSLLSELRRFGFDREGSDSFEFGRVEGAVRNDRELADLSIGLEATSITPLHAALIAATFANGGRMPEPRVIHASDGRLGLSPSVLEAGEGREVINSEMAAIGVGSMEAVTRFGGTGYNLAPAGFDFAMKTGTASDGRTGYHTNYIGFFPVSDPKVAFCVRVTHQRTSSRVRRATVKVMRGLFQSLDQLLKSRTF